MESDVRVRAQVDIPILQGQGVGVFFTFTGFHDSCEHFAVRLGTPFVTSPLVRLHSECITGDTFGSLRCDCGRQLDEALRLMVADGGYLLYLRQEGRGIGLYAKLDAYLLQDGGLDTYEANHRLNLPEDDRDFSCAAHMLRALNVGRVRLLTNNPQKATQLADHGIVIDEVVPTGVFANSHNRRYLEAKATKYKHAIALSRTSEAVLARLPRVTRTDAAPDKELCG